MNYKQLSINILLTGIFILMSCENDIEKVKAFSSDQILPVQTGYDVEIAYTDSGILKSKIFAPELDRYTSGDEPYIEFPKGIRIVFYDENHHEKSFIRADYAIYYQKKELGEARNHVVAKNEQKGEELYTEVLFWDQKSDKVYSDTYSKIVNPDGTFYGENGFEANQDLSRWKLKKSKGTVNLKDEQQPDQQEH